MTSKFFVAAPKHPSPTIGFVEKGAALIKLSLNATPFIVRETFKDDAPRITLIGGARLDAEAVFHPQNLPQDQPWT